MTRRVALVEITGELLLSVLGFPEGTTIVRVHNSDRLGDVMMVIENDALREVEDNRVIPTIVPMFKKHRGEYGEETLLDDWGYQ